MKKFFLKDLRCYNTIFHNEENCEQIQQTLKRLATKNRSTASKKMLLIKKRLKEAWSEFSELS